MDSRFMGSESIVGPDNGAPFPPPPLLSAEAKPQHKQERSPDSAEHHWKSFKLSRTHNLSTPKAMPLHQATPLLRYSNSLLSADTRQQERVLSFSSLKSEVPFISKYGGFLERSTQNGGFSCYQHTPSSYTRNAGYGCGSLNASMHGPLSGVGRPFTPSQRIELQHQALIYKYITANVPVPSNLLIPLKNSLYPYGLSSLYAGTLTPNSLGWSSFHLGYSDSTDPEPGRCRRTDGKKWRCSRDVIADQKYCERHINRGHHRSRKPVEGQTGYAVSGTTNLKLVPLSSPLSALVITSGDSSNSPANAKQHQFKNLQSATVNLSADTLVDRYANTYDSTFTVTKPFVESSEPDFGHVASDSLVNPSDRTFYMNSKQYGLFIDFTHQETQDQNSLQMDLGENGYITDQNRKQSNRIPICWGSSMGGPLGEALTNTTSSVGSCNNSSALSFLSEGSPPLGSSPTGVFHKAPLSSVSNCYSGSCPIGENNKGL